MSQPPTTSRALSLWWLWALLGTVLLLVASQRTWATGSWTDPVLGPTAITATGSQVAGTLTAGSLLSGAALLAGLVGTRPVRLAAGVCLAGGAVLAGLPAIRALTAPAGVLERVASEAPGSATVSAQTVDAAATAWPWVGLAAALVVLAGATLCLVRWWRERAVTVTATVPDGSPRGARRADPWDELTRGADPTLDPPDDQTSHRP